MSPATTPIIARPKRPPGVLICGKCLRKAEAGKAIRKALKTELTKRSEAAGRRPGKLVETKCLGLCPKRAVALTSGPLLARGELLVAKHLADIPAALDLLLDPGGYQGRV